MSCEHEHQHGSGHGHNHGDDHGHDHTPPIETYSSQSLLAQIELNKVMALNMENEKADLAKIFRSQTNRYKVIPVVESDADEQLIINIPFTGNVKLYSIVIRSDGDEYCPKTIKLYKNCPDLDFDSDRKATYTITHPQIGYIANEAEEEAINDEQFIEHFLPRRLFTNVNQLTLFVEDIYGSEDKTKLYYIELRGEWTPFTKDPVITLYEAAANPADHKNLTASAAMNQQL